MHAKDIMTADPACCLPEETLASAARLMAERDCGALPVVGDRSGLKIVGILTDRDIVCRAVAKGEDASRGPVASCMSTPVISITPETSVEECEQLMKKHRVRRLPVIGADGACRGIVTQADIARRAPADEVADVVKTVSREHTGSRLLRPPALPPTPKPSSKDQVQEGSEGSFPASDAPSWAGGKDRGNP